MNIVDWTPKQLQLIGKLRRDFDAGKTATVTQLWRVLKKSPASDALLKDDDLMRLRLLHLLAAIQGVD